MKKLTVLLLFIFLLTTTAYANWYFVVIDKDTGRKKQNPFVQMDSGKNLLLTADLLWSAANVYYIGDAINVAARLYTTDLANASLANLVTIAELDECVGLYVYDAGTPADHTIPRFDGTDGRTLQTSGIVIDDSDNVTIAGTTTTGGTADIEQLVVKANASQSNTNPLIQLQKSDGTPILGIHSDDVSNTFVGLNAGQANTVGAVNIGQYNTFVGSESGYSNTEGYFNTGEGYQALYANTTGGCNIAVGSGALYANTAGWYNCAIGYQAGYNETGSNKLYIANSNTATPLIYGDFSANELTINGALQAEDLYTTDDLRVLDEIQDSAGANAITVAQIYQAVANYVILGETSTTAYRGDRGKTAYDHVSSDGSSHADVVTNSGKVTESTTVTSPLALSTYNITIAQAGAAADGYLSQGDFNTFSAGAADQNLWETIATDGTSVAANTTTDILTIAGGGINVTSQAGDTITITGTEVDGSTTNEINTVQGDDNTATTGLAISIDGAGIVTTDVVGDILTITGTEVDGSTTNEINTITADDAGTTSGLAITLAGGGINATTRAGDTITVTATEAQLIFKTIATDGTSAVADATDDTLTLSGAGIVVTSESADTITITGTEADTLSTVCGRGNTYTGNVTITGNITATAMIQAEDLYTIDDLRVLHEIQDSAGANGVTVAHLKSTYDASHAQNTDTDLDATFEATFVKKADTVNVLSDITSTGANIEDAVTKKHTQGTDTTLGTMTADIDMNSSYQVVGLQAPAASGEAIRQTAAITEATLTQAIANYTADDTAYDATTWDANTDAATKNAIRDKVETMDTAISLNTDKNTNVSTALSVGTVGVNTVAITSDGGADDVTLPAATVTTAGMLTTAKWGEIVANNAKNTNVSTALSTGTVGATTYGITSDGGADDVVIAAATTDFAGVLTAALFDEIDANTAKNTNVSTTLTAGTVNATTYGITSDGGADDIVLPEADTNNAGLLGADKWDEIVANSLKTTNATHTGDVTGATALTIGANKILNTMIAADEIYETDINWGAGANQIDIDDIPDSSTYKRILAAIAAGDMIYCIDGSAWGIISKGADNQQLKMDGNYPNWETITAGNIDFATAAILGTL